MSPPDWAAREIKALFKPVSTAPSLRRVNGCGFTILGEYHHQTLGRALIAAHGFTLFFVPLGPRKFYLVSKSTYGAYVFHASIEKGNLARLYPDASDRLVVSSIKEAAIGAVIFVGAIAIVSVLVTALRIIFRR